MTNPSASDVARRLEILKYQVIYSMTVPPEEILAELSSRWSVEEKDSFQANLKSVSDKFVEAMKIGQLWEDMTLSEQQFLSSIPPNIVHQQHINAMWNQESVAVLMWSLGVIEKLPPYDTQTERETMKLIPDADLDYFVSSAQLRPDDELEKRRAEAELWHWRARNRQLIDEKRTLPENSSFASFDQIVQDVAEKAFEQGDIFQVLEKDFVAMGKPYRDLEVDQWHEIFSIAIERHRAFNWVCGYANENKWDETPTDT